MVDSANPTGHALELARSATPAPARRRTTLAAVARPAAEVAGLLLVEALRSPRARAVALGLARSLAGWLTGRRPAASAGVEVATRQVTVVQDANTSVLVHRVETRLVVRTPGVARGWPADDKQLPDSKGQQRSTNPQLESPILPVAACQATARKALLWQRSTTGPSRYDLLHAPQGRPCGRQHDGSSGYQPRSLRQGSQSSHEGIGWDT